jgi:hypothetical protein
MLNSEQATMLGAIVLAMMLMMGMQLQRAIIRLPLPELTWHQVSQALACADQLTHECLDTER